MAYGELNGHLLDDVTCLVVLFGTVTRLSESIGIIEKQHSDKVL